jgi:hypothetical protein
MKVNYDREYGDEDSPMSSPGPQAIRESARTENGARNNARIRVRSTWKESVRRRTEIDYFAAKSDDKIPKLIAQSMDREVFG